MAGSKSRNIHSRLDKYKVIDGEHWLWSGAKDWAGYGITWFIDRTVKISRLSAHLYLGLNLNDPKEQALHKPECNMKDCWNPAHLYIGSHSDNRCDISRSYEHTLLDKN